MNKKNETSDKAQNGNDFIADVRQRFTSGKYQGIKVARIIESDPDYFLDIDCSEEIQNIAMERKLLPWYAL